MSICEIDPERLTNLRPLENAVARRFQGFIDGFGWQAA
jgi:hypothetical protein